jgi:hypothetical protein
MIWSIYLFSSELGGIYVSATVIPRNFAITGGAKAFYSHENNPHKKKMS